MMTCLQLFGLSPNKSVNTDAQGRPAASRPFPWAPVTSNVMPQ